MINIAFPSFETLTSYNACCYDHGKGNTWRNKFGTFWCTVHPMDAFVWKTVISWNKFCDRNILLSNFKIFIITIAFPNHNVLCLQCSCHQIAWSFGLQKILWQEMRLIEWKRNNKMYNGHNLFFTCITICFQIHLQGSFPSGYCDWSRCLPSRI